MFEYIDSGIIERRRPFSIMCVFIMFIVVMTLSLIIFSMLYSYKTYYSLRGVIEEEENSFYLVIYVPINKLKYLKDDKKIKIDKKDYKYKIKDIDKEYLENNLITYQKVVLEIELPKEYQYNNLTLDLKIEKENKKIIKYIINF